MNCEFNICFPSVLSQKKEVQSKENLFHKLVDFDANLFHKDIDMDDAVRIAQANDVQYFVVPGSTLTDSVQAIDAAAKLDYVVAATAGVHPYNAETVVLNRDNVNALRELLSSKYCSAVGECGLDFSDGFPSQSLQMNWFRLQLSLAIEYDKPLYLHLRNSYESFVELFENETVGELLGKRDCQSKFHNKTLAEYFKENNASKMVVHCFTGSLEELKYYISLGCYIGLTGHVFTLPEDSVREILELIPLDKLVIETDAPYMGFKGCRQTEDKAKSRKYPNVPAALPKIATHIASILNRSYNDMCFTTTANVFSFFNKVIPGNNS